MNKDLKILQLTDIHGAEFLIDEIGFELKSSDIVVICGDITHFGSEEQARPLIDKIAAYNKNIIATIGNCDYPEVSNYLKKENYLADLLPVENSGFSWMGISGSLPCPGKTPNEFTESEIEAAINLKAPLLSSKSDPLILISHQPPYNTINDELPDGTHVGSKAIRLFIEQRKPALCLTGHIHEGIGIDKISDCPIVNPGPFRTGKYASIVINQLDAPKIELNQITV